MTPEQRLERLERITKLFVKAGRRARRELRDQDEKINMLIAAQMENEAFFATLAESQIHTDRRLDVLIDIIREDRNR